MGGLSIGHWIIVLVIVLVLFGRGRISEIMGDFGKGIHSFRKGMSEDGSADAPKKSELPPPPAANVGEAAERTTDGNATH